MPSQTPHLALKVVRKPCAEGTLEWGLATVCYSPCRASAEALNVSIVLLVSSSFQSMKVLSKVDHIASKFRGQMGR